MSFMRYLREIRRRGLLDSVRYLSRFGSFPVGNLVGKDEYGNQYFESKEALYGKDRWVDYASSDYDASQVPPDWHAWLHHITDEVPKEKLNRKYLKPHKENKTGTREAYHPPGYLYNARRLNELYTPEEEEWIPAQGKEREIK